MDPAAGIEAEYHHKNNRVSLYLLFCFGRKGNLIIEKRRTTSLRIRYPKKYYKTKKKAKEQENY